jgi:uncharacterized protein YmfQ (DUF2313 family)
MKPVLSLPTETSRAGDFARQLARAFGPAVKWAEGTIAGAFAYMMGDALADIYQIVGRALDEAFVTTATELLSEWETRLGLTVREDLSDAARRVRLIAKVRASRAGNPQGIIRALESLAGVTGVTITEITAEQASDVGNPRKVYLFIVHVPDSAYDNTTTRSDMRSILEQMKPAHTNYNLSTGSPFRVDNATLGRLDRNGLD